MTEAVASVLERMNSAEQEAIQKWLREIHYYDLDKAAQRAAYREYLKSTHWLDTRREAIIRAEFKCEVCGASFYDETLNVHHETYARLGNERPEDLTVLCRNCHRKLHNSGAWYPETAAERESREWDGFVAAQAIAIGPSWWDFVDAHGRYGWPTQDEMLARFEHWQRERQLQAAQA